MPGLQLYSHLGTLKQNVIWLIFMDLSRQAWDVSRVTSFEGTFGQTNAYTVFNSDISKWVMSSTTTLEDTFSGASAFNIDISQWGKQ